VSSKQFVDKDESVGFFVYQLLTNYYFAFLFPISYYDLMKQNHSRGLRTWIEVDTKAVKHNYDVFRNLISKKIKLMAVVKSNAYGHSLIDFSREMEKLGADFLGVDSITEALALRKEGIALPILVLGYTLPEMIALASEADISLTVSTFESLSAIQKAHLKRPLKIHIKVDTGMHRQGFLAEDLPKILGELKVSSEKLKVGGLFTHFASAKNPAFPKDTGNQIREFSKWIETFKKAGLKPIIHASATSGAMIFPKAHFDMVRVGIGLYGLWPAKEVQAFLSDKIELKPAMAWKTIISEIKKVSKGERVGYDLTETLDRDSIVAVCPVGYWHGFRRALSSVGRVLVRGKSAKILGRVSMDMLTIDITRVLGAKVGDEITIIGKDGRETITAEDIGSLSDTSAYEIITTINPLIKKIYI